MSGNTSQCVGERDWGPRGAHQEENYWVHKFHGMTLKRSRVFEGEGRKNNLEKAIGSKKDISSRPLSVGDVIFKNKQTKLSGKETVKGHKGLC